jgi:hypothetical protein
LDLVDQYGQALTANVDVGPYSTTGKENPPPPTRDVRQRHELTEIINRRVESSNRKLEYRYKDFRVKITNRPYRVPFTVETLIRQ